MKLQYILVLGLVVIVAAVMWCHKPSSTTVSWRPECPMDSVITLIDSVDRKGNQYIRKISRIPLADSITNVPEFHDCQRFIVADAYDSLYAIFASFRLGSLARSLDSLKNPQTYPRFHGTPALAAAEIYTWGGKYDTLGIAPHFDCLYLSGGQGSWHATMVPAGNSERLCLDTLDASTAPGKPLDVHEVRSTTFKLQDGDVPAVARWDWDPEHGTQYIGIKCGAAWCEVGGTGFKPSNPLLSGPPSVPVPGLPATAIEQQRVYQIKGWYDWQRLAVRSSTGSDLVPSHNIWGVMMPDPVLGRSDHDNASYFAPTAPFPWVHVATAVLSDSYPSKLSFEKGNNPISLCHGRPEACGVPPTGGACPQSADSTWWARIDHPLARPTFRCVTYRPHPPFSIRIPGTARWRWVLSDESGWARCTNGCCQIN